MAMTRLPDRMLGEAVATCFAQMQRPLAAASAILAPHAHAMTDVTGFGLAGHLFEMMHASGTSARLWLDGLPLMPGAEALARLGEHASLVPANRAALLGRIKGEGLATPRGALLFDPQTCGGLLTAVPQSLASDLVAELHAAGDTGAAIIGEVLSGAPEIVLTAAPEGPRAADGPDPGVKAPQDRRPAR
jgi:selenide,water dikinase